MQRDSSLSGGFWLCCTQPAEPTGWHFFKFSRDFSNFRKHALYISTRRLFLSSNPNRLRAVGVPNSLQPTAASSPPAPAPLGTCAVQMPSWRRDFSFFFPVLFFFFPPPLLHLVPQRSLQSVVLADAFGWLPAFDRAGVRGQRKCVALWSSSSSWVCTEEIKS